jgi:DNA-binding CsgD family transcriptional regulator
MPDEGSPLAELSEGEQSRLFLAQRLEARVARPAVVARRPTRRVAISGPDSLTPAERRVVIAAAGDATNREIAQTLFVSLRTVEMHLTNTYRKLGDCSRADLAVVIGELAGERRSEGASAEA